ncbi:MAG: DUF2238 domain-containing protein [archaeon]|nr:DUF2238 domain-containing protein [archaeon]
MFLRRGQALILWLNIIIILIFGYLYLSNQNYEFIIYVGIIIFFFALIVCTNRKVLYPNSVLWGMTIWAFLHMIGGILPVGDGRLYDVILIPISETYNVFRYDQFIHIFGFGVATLIMYSLLHSYFREIAKKKPVSLSIIVIMAGLGVGAFNEVVEFIIQVILPQTGIGGYVNSLLDLVSDMIGAILALVYIRLNNWKI